MCAYSMCAHRIRKLKNSCCQQFRMRMNASEKFAIRVCVLLGCAVNAQILGFIKWLWGDHFEFLMCLEWHLCVSIQESDNMSTAFKQACLMVETVYETPIGYIEVLWLMTSCFTFACVMMVL